MPANPAAARPVRIRLGQPITVDILGADGTRLRVQGILDEAPDRYTGDIATRLVLVDAVARALDG
jgi:hypothetical protein